MSRVTDSAEVETLSDKKKWKRYIKLCNIEVDNDRWTKTAVCEGIQDHVDAYQSNICWLNQE